MTNIDITDNNGSCITHRLSNIDALFYEFYTTVEERRSVFSYDVYLAEDNFGLFL